MTSEKGPKSNNYSWPNRMVRRLLNLSATTKESSKSAGEQAVHYGIVRRRKSCSDKEEALDLLGRKQEISTCDLLGRRICSAPQNQRMFVGTWNVGGRTPHGDLNLRDWLCSPAPADIYVLGFQEIVALNAGNILGNRDRMPVSTWVSLIGDALNEEHPREETSGANSGYQFAGSKRMVGIFLCVWLRAELIPYVSRLEVSSVARGVMGYVGNKGSISMSMSLLSTSFCFVCAHLTSGEKDRDEMRRNDDVVEILKRTKFSGSGPSSILEHERIVWLGDLNYRLTTSTHRERETLEHLVNDEDWEALLEKDQLRIHHRGGRIFHGWEEGNICFPPTYKYHTDSLLYNSSKSRRIPAWCDRILWRGEGIAQISYGRGESMFSDHRPVYSVFSVQLHGNSKALATTQSCLETARFRKHDDDKIFQEADDHRPSTNQQTTFLQ